MLFRCVLGIFFSLSLPTLSVPSNSSHYWFDTQGRRPCYQAQEPSQRTAKICNLRIYQIMVESFVDGDPELNYDVGSGPSHHRGDLQGIINSLPYIKELGANAIWMTPIFDPGFYEDQWIWAKRRSATGYFPKDYFSIAPHFGTLSKMKELVDTAHNLGLYVFLDGVFGHHKETGIIPSPQGKLPSGSHQNVSYPESLEFYQEVATYWIEELGIDGWRLDVANQVPLSAWRKINESVNRVCQKRKEEGETWGTLCYMVAEVWKDESTIQNSVHGPSTNPGLESAFNFSLRYALVKTLATQEWTNQKGAMGQAASILNQQYIKNENVFADHVMPNFMIGNHDLVRFGDLIERAGYSGPSSDSYWHRHGAAFSFLASYSGPVTIYYNEEIGVEVPNYADKIWSNCEDLGKCDDHVARTSGQIPGLAGEPLTKQQNQLLDHVKSLLQLKANHKALQHGVRRHIYSNSKVYFDLKFTGQEQIIYALNIADNVMEVSIPSQILAANSSLLRNLQTSKTIKAENGYFTFTLPPHSGQFFHLKDAVTNIDQALIYIPESEFVQVYYDTEDLSTSLTFESMESDISGYRVVGIPLGPDSSTKACFHTFCQVENLTTLSPGTFTFSQGELVPGAP